MITQEDSLEIDILEKIVSEIIRILVYSGAANFYACAKAYSCGRAVIDVRLEISSSHNGRS